VWGGVIRANAALPLGPLLAIPAHSLSLSLPRPPQHGQLTTGRQAFPAKAKAPSDSINS